MPPPQVKLVHACDLQVADLAWPFAALHAAEIDAHWQRTTAGNPAFFNGRVFMMADHRFQNGQFFGRLFAVEFKAFVYWKEHGAPDASVHDVFGSALIRSEDGAVLLGRQRAGNLNAGLFYLPGGFIDARDIVEGQVDIRGSVLREVEEETGLKAGALAVSDGFLITTVGRQVSIAVEMIGEGDAQAVADRIHASLQRQADAELEEIVAVRTPEDVAALPVPEYARVLLRHVLAPRSSGRVAIV